MPRLSRSFPLSKVSRLIYTNSGLAILALTSNAVHKLWKWPKNDRNASGKVSSSSSSSSPTEQFIVVLDEMGLLPLLHVLRVLRRRIPAWRRSSGSRRAAYWWRTRSTTPTQMRRSIALLCRRTIHMWCPLQEGRSRSSTWWPSRWIRGPHFFILF